jgi:hypothetical protein
MNIIFLKIFHKLTRFKDIEKFLSKINKGIVANISFEKYYLISRNENTAYQLEDIG